MSLRAALKGAVNSAFGAVGDIPETITLTVTTGGTYTPTGGASPTEVTYQIPAVVVKPTAEDLSNTGQGQSLEGMEGELSTFIVNRSDLEAAGFAGKPEVGDVITYQGNTYDVVSPTDVFGLIFKIIALRGSNG